MDRLLCTSLYRALLKSLTRKAVSENRLRNYFLDFAQQVTIICDDTDALSVLRALNYTQVQFRSLLRRVSERDTPPPHYLSRFINQAIEFIRTETDLLYYRLEHPQYFISESAPQSPLYWSKEHSAISVSEILCGLDRMTRSLCCWPTVRLLRSIWSFGSSRIRCMSNSAIRPMSNAVFWSAKRIARNLPRHCFIP